MKVILSQDIPKLGQRNDVKDVSDGYARNFLLPRGLAQPATEAALKQLGLRKIATERKQSEDYQKYQTIAERLKTLALSFKVKMGEKGRAYGSVTAAKIRDALKKQGIEIEKDWVALEEPIKTVGDRMVKINFPKEVRAEVKINVGAEN